mmetsp:Transcript_6982/g.6162  ORF Transcript_6982/g.6162 Transcript_6982/m.6162 type:complete len:362 (+) Transcript_6982:190-1275(+)
MEAQIEIIRILKADGLGVIQLKKAGYNFISSLDDPNKIVVRKAYKAASIWMKIETDMDYIIQQYPKLVKRCLNDGLSNRFTYRYTLRIFCELFERFSNVDQLNNAILLQLEKDSASQRVLSGVLSMLNFFNLKYGPEKIDTILFLENIGTYSRHANKSIREEALKFLVIAAKWKENTQSVLYIANGVLESPQYKLLTTMLQNIDKLEEPNFGEYLEDSDEETWYNQGGLKMDRDDILNQKFIEEIGDFKYNKTFLANSIRIYRWVDRVSKIDDVIFDCVSNKIIDKELVYLKQFIEHMLCSYNLNVLMKTQKLMQLLILKFKEKFAPLSQNMVECLVKSMGVSKPAYMTEIIKVYYYLSKY